MPREHVATVLMIEPEMPESVSAYGGIEGLALFGRFPNVDAVFLHSELNDYDCANVAKQIRAMRGTIPIVVLSPTGHTRCGSEITEVLSSHEPQLLLDYLRNRLGLPAAA